MVGSARHLICLSGLLAACVSGSVAWEQDEHRTLASRALAQVLEDCVVDGSPPQVSRTSGDLPIGLETPLGAGRSFAQLSAWSARDDHSRSRYHDPGRTILEQLRPLQASVIDATWSRLEASAVRVADPNWEEHLESIARSDWNVIANYLLHHLMALKAAELSAMGRPSDQGTFRRAMAYEAVALGYLGDAFSSGHLLVPMGDKVSWLHPRNNRAAHDHFRDAGVFVMNSRGDVWQAFGDKLLEWYAPTYDQTLRACAASLREVLLVYHASRPGGALPAGISRWAESGVLGSSVAEAVASWLRRQDGAAYYEVTKMPTLLLLPMPVSATWSLRTHQTDELGIDRRAHYPQLREPELHDPDTDGIDVAFLPRRAAVPDWLVPDVLAQHAPGHLVRHHPDVASVRYVQERSRLPSFAGLLLTAGGATVFEEGADGTGSYVGVGYGLLDELLIINKVSLEAVLMPRFGRSQRVLLAPTLGLGVKLSSLRAVVPGLFDLVDGARIEAGYAWGLRSPFTQRGFKLAVGAQTKTLPLGFTYAGVTVRVTHQWMWLDPTLRSLCVDVVLH